MNFSSKNISLIGVFAALHAVLYLISFGLWRNWSIYLIPLEGIILGPWVGLMTALIGSVTARLIRPTDFWMFGIIAEPIGVLACGLIAKKKWKLLIAIYAAMLASYFIHPFGRLLPLWTIIDILLAFSLIFPITHFLSKSYLKRSSFMIPLIAFLGIATDALTRIFLLIPAGFYKLFFWTSETVFFIFVAGAIDSYIEDILVVLVSFLIGVPLMAALKKIPGLKYPLS
jgi:hypothetical protein